jgi:hypothetical protein
MAYGAERDVVADTQGSSPQLFGKSEIMALIQLFRQPEQSAGGIGSPLPDLQVLETKQGFLHKSSVERGAKSLEL